MTAACSPKRLDCTAQCLLQCGNQRGSRGALQSHAQQALPAVQLTLGGSLHTLTCIIWL